MACDDDFPFIVTFNFGPSDIRGISMWDDHDQHRHEWFLNPGPRRVGSASSVQTGKVAVDVFVETFWRFLEKCEGGVRLVKKEQFVPFGFGRRVCMGEALAKDTLLIFFATLIKQLRWLPIDKGAKDYLIEGLRSRRPTWNLTQKTTRTVSLSYQNHILSTSNKFIVNKHARHSMCAIGNLLDNYVLKK